LCRVVTGAEPFFGLGHPALGREEIDEGIEGIGATDPFVRAGAVTYEITTATPGRVPPGLAELVAAAMPPRRQNGRPAWPGFPR
jgi:hypothetical protein